MRTFLNIIVAVFMVLVLSCTKNPVDDIRKLPVVITLEVMDVTDISALCKGEVIDMGDFPSPDFGIELNDGFGYRKYMSTQRSGNVFGVVFNKLLPSTTYTYRAFSEEGSMSYGKEKSFTTQEVFGEKMVLGTYAELPRMENGRADIPKLIVQLRDLHANTYNWLVWKGEKDWDDLILFLPVAKQNNISVWITIVPPSESKPKAKWNSEPYGTDYLKWCAEIAKLSVQYHNLVAISIDDFVHNLSTYTPSYLEEMISVIDQYNPKLQFIPCSYYRQITPSFVFSYQEYFDGILFPYRAESDPAGANLKNPDLVKAEIEQLRKLFNTGLPIYIDVYSHAHSKLGATTPEYVEKVINDGGQYADGVLIYCHPNKVTFPEKYNIVKDAFLRLASANSD